MRTTTEVTRRVFDDDSGAFISVGPDMDALGLVMIKTDDFSERHYGKCYVVISQEMAQSLGKALLKATEEI